MDEKRIGAEMGAGKLTGKYSRAEAKIAYD
jgi:hypothetical protein